MTNKPCSLIVEHYDTTIKIEKDHSDIDIFELFEMFKTACLGMTFPVEVYNNALIQLAEDIYIKNEE